MAETEEGEVIRAIIVGLFLFLGTASAGEKEIGDAFCRDLRGQREYALDDGTRVDCLGRLYAWEVEYAHKFYEAVGQSLYYALKTGKRPGIALIMESQEDLKYYGRLLAIRKFVNPRIGVVRIDKEGDRLK